MRKYDRVLIFITWAIDIVSSQGYLDADVGSCATCEHKYTYRGARKGIFTSPGFPENYPERITCCYFFHAKEDGRVRIEFDYFDLEPSDNECRYDYIEISSINTHGYKEQPKSLYCGTTTPPVYISSHSKLEVVFHSDVTTNAKGFLAHYEFLETNWHPFPPSTIGCGPGYLTGRGGSIHSPNFPNSYPAEAGCTWVIQVTPDTRILLTFVDLDITTTEKCQEKNLLMLFDGFITPDKDPIKYCGQLANEPESRRDYLSDTERVVIRFQSGQTNAGDMKGVHISWTEVTIKKTGTCDGFQCARAGSGLCGRSFGPDLCNDHHYCIDDTLQCNELPNCGAIDNSDENKCLNYIMKYVGYIGVPVFVVVVIAIVTTVCCIKKRCCCSHVKYSAPAEQSLTHSCMSTQSSNMQVQSLDHSPRSSCMMYTTSFTDYSVIEKHTSFNTLHNATKAQTSKEDNGAVSTVNSLANSHNLHLPITNSMDKVDPVEVLETPYKGHQKRPSYHLMRELCYDEGNIVVADI